MLKNDTKFQAQTERANFCSFQLRMSKVLKLKQIPRSSSPRICGFKPLTDIFPAAERPDNRMQKRLMTKPWRGRRAKEHRVIPANDPNVPKHKFMGKNKWRAKHKTPKPKQHIKSIISWEKMLTRISKNTKSLKVRASSTILGNQLICNIVGSTFLQSLAQHNNHSASGKFFLSL